MQLLPKFSWSRRVRASFLLLWGFSATSKLSATTIHSIQFRGTSDPQVLTIDADGPIAPVQEAGSNDHELVLRIPNTSLKSGLERVIDAQGFGGNVTQVLPKNGSDSSLVLHLKHGIQATLSVQGNTALLSIPGGPSNLNGTSGGISSASAKATDSMMPADKPMDGTHANAGNEVVVQGQSVLLGTRTVDPDGPPPGASGSSSPDAPPVSAGGGNDAGNTVAGSVPTAPVNEGGSGAGSNLQQFMREEDTRTFTGRPITMQVKNAEVTDVLRLIGEASGFNVVVSDDVKGNVTLSLVDVPWDQVLDVVLHSLHLGAERNNNILRVATLAGITKEKNLELAALRVAQASSPKITRVFPISYATLGDLQTILSKLNTAVTANSQGTPGASGAAAAPTSISQNVQIDNRTNSLVAYDTAANIERMKKLIDILDTQTPQVLIEAKVVEASEAFSKSLSGSLGIGSSDHSTLLASLAGGDPIDALLGSSGVFSGGTDFAKQAAPSGGTPNLTLGTSPNVSFIPGVGRLNAVLSWGESENQLKVISAPKTVVLNKQSATITEGTPVLVPGTTTVAGVGTVQTASVQSANLSLKVTPTVTNEGGVLLNLTVTKDVTVALATGSGIGDRNITTNVLVDSGSTLVIGGIYTMETTTASAGVPFLRKIPFIGPLLFGNESESVSRTELFIFITPRILNPRDAGLAPQAA